MRAACTGTDPIALAQRPASRAAKRTCRSLPVRESCGYSVALSREMHDARGNQAMALFEKTATRNGKVKALPKREKVKPTDCWDLASLFKTDAAWEAAFTQWSDQIPGYEQFKGKIGE